MQNQQQMAMAMNANAMNANNMGGPVNGTPVMGNLQRPGGPRADPDPRKDPLRTLNTYIYDYFIRNNHRILAKTMLDSDMNMNLKNDGKPSPSGRNVNGVDGLDDKDLPSPDLPPNQLADNSFLGDWWAQFWDIWNATRNKGADGKSTQYALHTRNLAQMTNEQRTQRMLMANNMNAQQYQNMIRLQQNGGAPNDLKRAAAMNNRPNGVNPMANMNQMKNQAMMSAQMQRDGSGMDMNGQRPPSPGSAENAPSPNKRPRVEGNYLTSPRIDAARIQGVPQPLFGATTSGQANQMLLAGGMNTANMASNQFNEFAPQGQNVQQKSIEVYAQSLAQQQRIALNNHAMAQGMNAAGNQGSPMAQQGLDGQHDMFAGNQQRPGGMPTGPPGQPQGNHALQDYQMQLMLLEQQNKKRLLMARQEQDSMSGGPHNQPGVGGPGFAPAMSPQGSRAGPSPNPADQMKRGTPKLGQQGLPASPMPDAAMQQQRNSPTPNMNFDPNQMPPGMPPQFGVGGVGAYPQMPQNPMMRPPSSHPGFNQQQMNPQQLEAMRNMQNGAWRGGPGGPGGPQMMPGQAQQMGGPMPQQRNPMPPPPAPPAGEQPRAQEPSPSQPAQASTPSQTPKPAPKKKLTKNDKKAAKPKGANTGATPAATGEDPPPTPTPSTPVISKHPNSFGQNGQPQPGQPPQQQSAAPQPPPMVDNGPGGPFGSITEEPNFSDIGLDAFGDNDLNSFDFDSFLHVGDDAGGFGALGGEFGFGDGVEAGGDI